MLNEEQDIGKTTNNQFLLESTQEFEIIIKVIQIIMVEYTIHINKGIKY